MTATAPELPAAPSFAHRLRVYATDIKISHSIFALPFALLATFVGAGGMPAWGILGLILLCMVTARTLAMSANRLLDARLDAANPRTLRRAIPSGQLSRSFVLGGILLCAVLFILATAGFWFWYDNPWPLVFSLPVLAFISAYPLLKHFTQLCHYYLGASLALALICAWVAVTASIALEPLLMAGAVLLWTAGFDIIYACQDYAVDVRSGLYSVPARLGIARALWVSRLTHFFCAALLIALGLVSPLLAGLYFVGVGIAIALLLIEHSLVHPNDLSRVGLAFFTINGIISAVLGVLGIIDVFIS